MKLKVFLEYFGIFLCLVVYLGLSLKPISSTGGESRVLGIQTQYNGPFRGEAANFAVKPEKALIKEYPKELAAKSFLVRDKSTGEIIYSKNIDEKLAIASLTKLMTTLIALESLDLTQEIIITEADRSSVSPHLGYMSGESFVLQDLIFAILIGSSNDATLAIGNTITKETGKNVVGLMNKKALELGMTETSFANPMGFDDSANYSTARDVSKLLTECMKHGLFEIIGKKKLFTLYNSQGKPYNVKATNKLISSHSDIQSIKTGNSPEAKGAMVTQVNIQDHNIEIIVLGSSNREDDTLILKQFVSETVKWNKR